MALTWRLERPEATTIVSAIVDFCERSMVTTCSALALSKVFNTLSTKDDHWGSGLGWAGLASLGALAARANLRSAVLVMVNFATGFLGASFFVVGLATALRFKDALMGADFLSDLATGFTTDFLATTFLVGNFLPTSFLVEVFLRVIFFAEAFLLATADFFAAGFFMALDFTTGFFLGAALPFAGLFTAVFFAAGFFKGTFFASGFFATGLLSLAFLAGFFSVVVLQWKNVVGGF